MNGSFQPADQHVDIHGEAYTLRLSLGALAEISSRLNAHGPKALSREMKALTPSAACEMVRALLRPCHSAAMPTLEPSDLTGETLKALARIFEQSFAGLNKGQSHER